MKTAARRRSWTPSKNTARTPVFSSSAATSSKTRSWSGAWRTKAIWSATTRSITTTCRRSRTRPSLPRNSKPSKRPFSGSPGGRCPIITARPRVFTARTILKWPRSSATAPCSGVSPMWTGCRTTSRRPGRPTPNCSGASIRAPSCCCTAPRRRTPGFWTSCSQNGKTWVTASGHSTSSAGSKGTS